ncbi:MAG: GNAT family N-acetyltransferase [Pseudomonadales bacterium]|nr:GNAT family N-acetyltransferase [Pseudomonadales bacterium]
MLELHTKALEDVGGYIPGPWNDDLDSIDTTYIASRGDFLVGEIEGIIVAMGAVKCIDLGSAEIKRIRVDPRLQRQGLGQRILEKLEARSKELGYETLILDTLSHQIGAIRFFEKNGYKRYGTDKFEGFEQLLYKKTIRAAA